MTNKSWKKIWNKNAKQIKPKNLNELSTFLKSIKGFDKRGLD